MSDKTSPVEQVSATITKQPGLMTQTTVTRGSWETLKSTIESTIAGTKDRYGANAQAVITTATLSRTQGGYADLSVTVTAKEEISILSVEYMELQKPIRTWKAGTSNAPDLAKLAAWEKLGQSQATQSEYGDYVYELDQGTGGNKTLAGDTLKLAKMIREEGIETYAVYTPVITITTFCVDFPTFGGVGKTGTPGVSGTVVGDGQIPSNLATAWLKVADNVQVSMDGTIQRVERWIGADKWNADLYPSSN